MSRFIKLTKYIVNTSKIIKIDISPTKYNMYLSEPELHGFFIVSSGAIQSYHNRIEVCKNKHPEDYEIVKKWIDQIKTDE